MPVSAPRKPKKPVYLEMDRFIEDLSKDLRDRQLLGPNQSARVEVVSSQQVVYQGTEGQTPQIRQMSLEDIAYLKAALRHPADPSAVPDPNLDRDVTVRVNGKVVFHLSQGVIETNLLQPTPAQQQHRDTIELNVKTAPEPKKVIASPLQEREKVEESPQPQGTELRNLAAVAMVQDILRANGCDSYEGDQYMIQRSCQKLSFIAQDGRGEILAMVEGKISGTLTAQDLVNLRQLQEQLCAHTEEFQATAAEPDVCEELEVG